MLKPVFLVVQPVGNMFSICGAFRGLFSAVKNTGFMAVYKNGGLYKFIQDFYQWVIHVGFRFFISVNSLLIPTIHTTYNKLQLININNFVISNRRSV